MSISKIIKNCKDCGAEIVCYSSAKKYCEECRRIREKKNRLKHKLKNGYKDLSETEKYLLDWGEEVEYPPRKHNYTGPTLDEIMREANKEGLQYAAYCKKHGL